MKTLKPEEAITILEEMKVNISIPKAAVTQIKRNAALNMAIDALLKCSEIPNDSDTISRQAAIDALSHMMDTDGFRDGWAVSRANVDCMLRSLPAAEPEIIRCKDCKYYHPSFCEVWSKYGTVQTVEDGYCYKAERRSE